MSTLSITHSPHEVSPGRLVAGFIAGFLAVLLFHQPVLLLLRFIGGCGKPQESPYIGQLFKTDFHRPFAHTQIMKNISRKHLLLMIRNGNNIKQIA